MRVGGMIRRPALEEPVRFQSPGVRLQRESSAYAVLSISIPSPAREMASLIIIVSFCLYGTEWGKQMRSISHLLHG
jgi:hypothetical protein